MTSSCETETQSEQGNFGVGVQAITFCNTSVQTCLPHTSDVGVQADNCHFLMRFLSNDAKVYYYTGLPECALLLSLFEFVMKHFCHGEKWSFYLHCFIIVLLKLCVNLGM